MSASHEAVLRDIAGKLPVRPNARKRQIWMACMAIGAISFAVLLFTQPTRAWGSFAINTLYWLGIAMGGIVLSSAVRLANGRWAGPFQRVAESFSAYLPVGIAAMVVLLAAGIWTYLPWPVRHNEPRHLPFFNVPFLYVRTLLGLGLFWWSARDLVRISLRTDAHLLKDHVAAELRPEYEKLSAGWRGDEAEVAWQRHRLAQLAPRICVIFAVSFTLLAWDFIMGLTPEWVSGLFGWWVFMGAFLTGIAMTAFLAAQLRAKYGLEAYITPVQFQDLGKLLFAICIFWVYQFWSQYLPIWYANMPEETWWVFLRFEEPWRAVGFTVFGLVFLFPFVGLMNQTTKRSPFWMTFFSLMVLFGMWLERHILIMPSLEPEHVWIGLPEVGVTLGFLGLFGWTVQGFLTKYPAVKVTDALVAAEGHGH